LKELRIQDAIDRPFSRGFLDTPASAMEGT